MAGASGAVLFCLHGCGYTGLTWAAVAAALKDRCGDMPKASCCQTEMCLIKRSVGSAG